MYTVHVANVSICKQELASHIPALSNVEPQKLSKHVVVEESIARHEQLEESCVEALGMIQALAKEREELLAEVNTWRAGAGLPPHQRTASASTQGLATIEANSEHHPRVAYAGSSTPEANVDYQPLHVPRDQLGGAHYAQNMAPATDIGDRAGLPDDDLVSMWSLMDAQGVPVIPTSGAFPDTSHGQHQQTLPAELGMF